MTRKSVNRRELAAGELAQVGGGAGPQPHPWIVLDPVVTRPDLLDQIGIVIGSRPPPFPYTEIVIGSRP
jgi:hypothetical protein